jgi:hypothetical protein
MSNKVFNVVFVLIVMSISVWYVNATQAKVVTDGLISFWTFDDANREGDIIKDVWGNNDGTAAKNQIVEGKIGQAMEFEGSNDRVDCGNDPSLDLTDALTIELWMMPTAVGEGGPNAGPMCKAEAAVDPWSWQLRYNAPGGFMGFQFNASPGGSTWISVQENLEPDEWYHITGTFDGETARCYLNGVETDSIAMGGIVSGNGRVLIGEDGWVNVFVGVVDEVRMYDRALTEAEILQNYNSTDQLAVEPADKLAVSWGQIKKY